MKNLARERKAHEEMKQEINFINDLQKPREILRCQEES